MSNFSLTRRSFTVSALALLAAGRVRAEDAARQGMFVHGGPIYTGVGTNKVDALLLRGNKIAFAGTLSEARSLASNALNVDLGGRAAFPGFYDSHVHLTGLGLSEMQLNLVGTPSIDAVKTALAEHAKNNPTGPIVGSGWIETHWPEKRFLSRADLDAVVNDRPVVLSRADGHATAVNSAALALAGIDRTTRDPDGGQILRDAEGEATGMLIDNAQTLIESKLPPPTREMKKAALARATALYASRGWTGAAHVSATMDDVALLGELAAENRLPFPVDVYLSPAEAGEVFARGPYADASGLVQVRGIKAYMDGALGSRGAALLAPYSDAPGSGLLVTPVEELRALLKRARASKIQVATHAIGDRGNRLVLDAYEATFVDDPAALKSARWRIEHAQVIAPEDIPRFARLGIIASMQPSHAISDLYFAPSRLGDARLKGAYAWKSLLDSGAIIAAGTDAPVEKGDPLIEFYAAAHRHALNGFQGRNWHPEETISREQALTMLTRGGAYASFREKQRGTLEAGKSADISIFSADLMTAPFAEIAHARANPFGLLSLGSLVGTHATFPPPGPAESGDTKS
jgi:predicted amidohydrolase YtcJ